MTTEVKQSIADLFPIKDITNEGTRSAFQEFCNNLQNITPEHWQAIQTQLATENIELKNSEELAELVYTVLKITEKTGNVPQNIQEALTNVAGVVQANGMALGIELSIPVLESFLHEHQIEAAEIKAILEELRNQTKGAVSVAAPQAQVAMENYWTKKSAVDINNESAARFTDFFKALQGAESIAGRLVNAHQPLSDAQRAQFVQARKTLEAYLATVSPETHEAMFPGTYTQLSAIKGSFEQFDADQFTDKADIIHQLNTPFTDVMLRALLQQANQTDIKDLPRLQNPQMLAEILKLTMTKLTAEKVNEKNAYKLLQTAKEAVGLSLLLFLVIKYGAPQHLKGQITTREEELRDVIAKYNEIVAQLKKGKDVDGSVLELNADDVIRQEYFGVFSAAETHLLTTYAITGAQNSLEGAQAISADIAKLGADLRASLQKPQQEK